MALKETNKNRKKKKETIDNMGEGNVTFPKIETVIDSNFSNVQRWVIGVGVVGFILLFFL